MVTATGQKEITQTPYTVSHHDPVRIKWIGNNIAGYSGRREYLDKVTVRRDDGYQDVSDLKILPTGLGDVIYGYGSNGVIYALGLPASKTHTPREIVYSTKPFGFTASSKSCSELRSELQSRFKLDDPEKLVICLPDMLFFNEKENVTRSKQLGLQLAY